MKPLNFRKALSELVGADVGCVRFTYETFDRPRYRQDLPFVAGHVSCSVEFRTLSPDLPERVGAVMVLRSKHVVQGFDGHPSWGLRSMGLEPTVFEYSYYLFYGPQAADLLEHLKTL